MAVRYPGKTDAAGNDIPATEYVVVNKQQAGRTDKAPDKPPPQQQQQRQQVSMPKGVPAILGNRSVIFSSWAVSMVVVCFDEWHNYHILPRPARLWYTSLTFGLLVLASIPDALVPLANAFAIGFTIMLIWQYYNGSGQFAQGAA
jgi:hypothetical protein